MHARIRLGYDRTVADAWRAKVAEVEAERDKARADLAAWAEGKRGVEEYLEVCALLASERERVARLEAELDRLRVALVEARDFIVSLGDGATMLPHESRAVGAIDAALAGKETP